MYISKACKKSDKILNNREKNKLYRTNDCMWWGGMCRLNKSGTSMSTISHMHTLQWMSPSQDLIDDLKGELGGKFETLIVALMTPPLAYDVEALRNAIKVGTVLNQWHEWQLIHKRTAPAREWPPTLYGAMSGGRNRWEGPRGDPGFQNMPADQGYRCCLQTG